MCNLHHLVFRQGKVLASEKKLSFEDASKIAEDMKQNVESAIDKIIDALINRAENLGGSLAVLNRDDIGTGRVRTVGQTIQVDFPAFKFDHKNHSYETRTVVTVCVDDKQSKCWTKVSMRDDDADYPDAAHYFDQLETLAEEINDVVVAWYDEKIKEGVGGQFGVDVDFTMNVRTASGDDSSFDDYFRGVYEKSPGKEDEKWAQIRRDITRTLAVMNPGVDHARKEQDEDGNIYRRFGIATERPIDTQETIADDFESPDSDSANAIVSMIYNDTKAEFTGVGYDRFYNSNSSSFTLSSLASRSIAIEYGSLF